jgi:diguanylate cyclase (GGDEF)-like protein
MPLALWCNMATLALDRRRLHDKLSFRAQHDELTGLPNRASLYERVEVELERSRCERTLLGVLYIDLDGFKQINDSYGHDAGDTVLRESARRMTLAVRRSDTVARMGGDEFVVLLPLINRREDAQQISEKIAAAIREPIRVDLKRLSVSACVGIAIWPLDADRPEGLLRLADSRMYMQKRSRLHRPVLVAGVAAPDVSKAIPTCAASAVRTPESTTLQRENVQNPALPS